MSWTDWVCLAIVILIFSPIPDIIAIRKMEKEHPEWFEDA